MSKTCKECGCPMDDSALVCPECGCPTTNLRCPSCGAGISGHTFCPYCGTQVRVADTNTTNGTLTINWKGTWGAPFQNLYVSVNGQAVSNLPWTEAFSVSVPLKEKYTDIRFKNCNSVCDLQKGHDYTCTLSYNRWVGQFTHVIVDEKGHVVFTKGIDTGRFIIQNIFGCFVTFIFISIILFLFLTTIRF